MKNGLVAVAVAVVLASTGLMAQQTGQVSGTAKDEAKTPYTDYSVRLRDVVQAQIAGSTPLAFLAIALIWAIGLPSLLSFQQRMRP